MTTCRLVRDDDRLRARPQCRSRAHASVVGPMVVSVLVQLAAIGTAVLLGLPWPAIAGIALVVAIAATVASRRTVGSLLAGAGLRVAQPYGPGEQIRVFVPSLDSVEDAEIVRVGPANTTLMTARGLVLVPNADMLRGGARH